MEFFRCTLAAMTIAVLACACADVKPKPVNPVTGQFPASKMLDADAVQTIRPFRDSYKKLVYLKVPDDKPVAFGQFYSTELNNMHVFDKVAMKSDIEAIVIQRDLSGTVPSISDMVGLHKLAEAIGPFLVVEPYVEWKGGYNFIAQLKAIDPQTGETVLLLQQHAFNWAGLEGPMIYPLLNGFMRWTKGQEILTKGSASSTGAARAAN